MPFKYLRYLVLFTIISLCVAINWYCGTTTPVQKEALVYLNHADSTKYMGMATCRKCHENIYQTFIETGMGQSFGEATKMKSKANFVGNPKVYDAAKDLYYMPYFKDSIYYIKEYRLSGRDTIYSRTERVNYIIGSGQHTNSHLMLTNGYLTQMPITYYTQLGKWDLAPGFEAGNNTRFDRKIEQECMSCHNAYPTMAAGSTNKYVSIGQGIDCERCHGPGSIHVADKMAGNIIDTSKYIDYTIVNPKKLPYDLQVEICQRCHLQGNAVLKDGKTWMDFKPGMKLSDYISVFAPEYEDKNQIIMASHVQRLKQSECFIESAARKISVSDKKYLNAKLSTDGNVSALTCISCHNPHVSVKVTGKQIYNKVCDGCHKLGNTYNLNQCTENPKALALKNNNCVSCHMPSTGSVDIPHVSVHDHKISIPASLKEVSDIKSFVKLYAVNNSNSSTSEIAEGYLSYFEKFEQKAFLLDSAGAYLNKMTESGAGLAQKAKYFYLRKDYPNLIALASKPEIQNANAFILYYIGKGFENTQNHAQAADFYRKALAKMPLLLEIKTALANSLLEINNTTEAEKVLNEIIAENPKTEAAYTNLGYVYMLKNEYHTALKYYFKALSLDPDNIQALINTSGWYIFKKDKTKAKLYYVRALKLAPQNAQVVQLGEALR